MRLEDPRVGPARTSRPAVVVRALLFSGVSQPSLERWQNGYCTRLESVRPKRTWGFESLPLRSLVQSPPGRTTRRALTFLVVAREGEDPQGVRLDEGVCSRSAVGSSRRGPSEARSIPPAP